MCWKLKNKDEESEDKLYQKGLIKKINRKYKKAQEIFNQILERHTCSSSSYWNKAYKELADIDKLKRERTRRWCRRICLFICPFLLLFGCILIGKALGKPTCSIPAGLLGGAGVGFLLVALCLLFISGENDY